jgi:cytochrome P450 family 114
MSLHGDTYPTPVDALAMFGTEEFLLDPYPFLKWLRENDPVHLTSKGYYLVSRHSDLVSLLSGTTDLLRTPDIATFAEFMPQIYQHKALETLLSSILSMNPPEHTRVRRLVARVFTRRAVEEFRERIGLLCDRLLYPITEMLRDGEVVDLYPVLCQPLPRLVIAELLGVPRADHDWLTRTTIDIAAGIAADSHQDAEEMMKLADEQTGRLQDYFRKLAAERRKAPGDDLISGLARSQVEDPDRLTDDELVNLAWFLWVGGTDSTAVAMIHCVWTMTQFPGQCHWLRGDFDESLAFVDEVLRRTTSILYTVAPRFATRDLRLSGVTCPAGSDVRAVFAAANRDPGAFADPDRFDPARDNRNSLTFGKGTHHCLGAFLARNALAMGLSRLHARFPGLVAISEPHWGGLVRDPSLHSLPVAVHGA